MGYGASASVYLGVQLREDDLRGTVRERGCRHQLTKVKFCGECGKPAWVEKRGWLPGFDARAEDSDAEVGEKGSGLRLHKPNADTDQCVLGVQICATTYRQKIVRATKHITDDLRLVTLARITKLLQASGLPQTTMDTILNTYGTYVVLDESY